MPAPYRPSRVRIGREIPLAGGSGRQANQRARLLPGLHQRVFFLHRPGGEVFIYGEDETGIGRFIVEQFFHPHGCAQLRWNQRFDLLLDLFFGLAKGHAAGQ